jgi:hypothetical protein
MFLLRENKRKGLEFLGMGDRRKELSFWFVVCVCVCACACVRMESGAVMRVRVNGNSFGDRFKVKTLFTPKFFLLASRSVGGKIGWRKSKEALTRNTYCIVTLTEWYVNRKRPPSAVLVMLWIWFCFVRNTSQILFLYPSLLEINTPRKHTK